MSRVFTNKVRSSDTGSFGSLQALPSFLNRFGVDDGTGKITLPPTRKALMNSLPWIGKILGCFLAEPYIERAGYKKSAYTIAAIQIVAVISKSPTTLLGAVYRY